VDEASIIGVSRRDSWGDRLRASALPAESAPANIAKYIDEKLRAMKQPVLEIIAFSGKVEFGLLRESPLI
jgi:hypothetical protein